HRPRSARLPAAPVRPGELDPGRRRAQAAIEVGRGLPPAHRMSPDWMSPVLLAVAALVVGLFIGTTSVGGVMLIPALIFWGGLEVHQAAATLLASSLFTGALGTWLY